ncbi:MAG: hypothetical protein CVU59_02610 [Deltaproteobacteria bacterium HGW-Deltaproteobacteria-17]|nr:MAG: hypothetical protein CVU59_02610 [Deltaproteobacteria bacterium HGW-Deltaproteobacteria-17]
MICRALTCLFAVLLMTAAAVPAGAQAKISAEEKAFNDDVMAGAALMVAGNPGAAGHYFTEALKNQQRPQLYSLILLALIESGELPAAIKLCSQNVELARRDANFHYWCGRLSWLGKDRTAAVKSLENALSLGGDSPHLLMTAALMQAQTGNAARAALYFTRLIRRDPWVLHTRLYPSPIAGLLFALEDLFARSGLGASFPHALSALALRANMPDLSRQYLEAAWKGYGTPPEELHQLRHQLYRAWGRPALLELAFSEGIKAYPKSVHFRFHSALRLIEQGKPERARNLLLEVTVDEPKSALVLSLLGLTQLETGQVEAARKTLAYARAQNEELALLDYAEGLFLQKTGAPQKAREALQRAVKREPTNTQFGAAYLAALAAARDTKAQEAEQKRQKAIAAYFTESQDFEKKYQARLEALEKLAAGVKSGKPVVFPATCDLQCLVLKGYVELAAGRPWNPAAVLARLGAKDLWFPALPLHAWKKEIPTLAGEKLVVIKYFQSVLPSQLD